MVTPTVRFRVDFSDACAIGPGKVALLEAIGRTGSLSAAARALKMSYRRGWLLLDSLNHSFRRPVAELSKGGRGGGGASLTPFGRGLVVAYRRLEADVVRRARTTLASVAREAIPDGDGPAPRRAVRRRARG
ncbi:MAG: LysR family transcriptional regulator [Proteobacteria bacterium]|nr:LysR family transcriptional regulator [Pseudomonadota bacterium]